MPISALNDHMIKVLCTCLLPQLVAGIDARRVGVRNHVLVEVVPEPAPHISQDVGGHGPCIH